MNRLLICILFLGVLAATFAVYGQIRQPWVEKLADLARTKVVKYGWSLKNSANRGTSEKRRRVTRSGNLPKDLPRGQRVSKPGTVHFRSSDPTLYIYENGRFRRPTDEEVSAREALVARRAKDHKIARDLLEQGDRQRARPILESLLREEPGDNLVASDLTDLCFAERNYPEAFYLIGRFVDEQASPDVLTRAALASAKMGWVYNGQKQYCDDLVVRAYEGFTGVKESLPQGSSAADVEISASLALGLMQNNDRLARFYFDMTLLLDSENSIAGYALGEVHLRNKNYRGAVRVYEIAATHGIGSIRMMAARQLELAKSLYRHFGS